MTGEDQIIYRRKGAAAILEIDRQERRNAVDSATAAKLLDGYRRFESEEDARVMVLTGAGDVAFCAGFDLKSVESFEERDEGPLGFTRLTSKKPTIAAISGWCLAGGMELALWCDLRIATEGSTFGFPERRWGVPLIDGGTQRLPRVVGLGRALDLVLTGRMVGAEEALSMGLVTEVVAEGEHLKRSLEVAGQLAGFPQETMLSDREAVYRSLGATLEQGLEAEKELGWRVLAEAAKGAARFASGEGRHGEGTFKDR